MVILTSREAVDISTKSLSFLQKNRINKRIKNFIKQFSRKFQIFERDLTRDEEILNRFTIESYEKLYQKYSLSGLSSEETAKILLSTSILKNFEHFEVAFLFFSHKLFPKQHSEVLKDILDKYSKLKHRLQDIAILKGTHEKIKSVIPNMRELDYLEAFMYM